MSTKAKRIKLNANEIQFEAKILEGFQSTFIVVLTLTQCDIHHPLKIMS
jgi:hypothetical protein